MGHLLTPVMMVTLPVTFVMVAMGVPCFAGFVIGGFPWSQVFPYGGLVNPVVYILLIYMFVYIVMMCV